MMRRITFLKRSVVYCTSALLMISCAVKSPQQQEEIPVIAHQEIPLPQNIQDIIQQAQSMANNNQMANSVQLLMQTLAEYPDYPQLLLNVAGIELRQNQFKKAKKSVEDAIHINGQYAPSHNLYGIVLRHLGEFDVARQAYEKAITLNPNYLQALLNAGILADLYLMDWPAALGYFQQYQKVRGQADPKVNAWIVELKRRMSKSPAKAK